MPSRNRIIQSTTGILVVLSAVAFTLSLPAPSTSEAASEPAAVTRPSAPSSYLLGDELQISTPSTPTDTDRYQPAIAYNSKHGEYLVVWHNTWSTNYRDIYAQRVSKAGKLIGPWFAITYDPSGLKGRSNPAVAYNATNDEYLVVWMYDVGGNGNRYEIWGKIIPWNGPGTNSEFLIYKNPDRSAWSPRVAWNSLHNEYMVVWNLFNFGTHPTLPILIGNKRVTSSGTVPYADLSVTAANTPHQVDLAYNSHADEYMVVWVRVYAPSPSTDNDIYGAVLRWDGTIVHSDFAIYNGAYPQVLPSVASNNTNRYMVVWQHAPTDRPSQWDIKGQELDVDGNKVGTSPLTIAATTDSEEDPDIAANGTAGYMAAWVRKTSSDDAIYGRRWGSSVTTYNFEVASSVFWYRAAPAVAGDGLGFFTAYEGISSDPTDKRHIYGRLFSPEALFLPVVFR